jgi:membrane protease YdiL (CAAX protease family)
MFVAILAGIFVIGSILTIVIIYAFATDPQQAFTDMAGASQSGIDMMSMGMAPAASLAMVVAPFACGLAVLCVLVKPLHLRPVKSIITGMARIRWGRILAGFGLWMLITILLECITYQLEPEEYIFSFDSAVFWPSLLAAIVLLPLQTSFEEVALRGYFMQGLGLATKSPLLALLISSTAFGLMHFANPEMESYGASMMFYYIGTGLFLGLITLMDEGLELALGVHFANNLYAASAVTYPSSVFIYPSVYQMKTMDVEGALLGWFIMASSMTLVFTFLFKWKDWGKLFRQINMPYSSNERTSDELGEPADSQPES